MAFTDLETHISEMFCDTRWSQTITLVNNLLHYRRQIDRAYRERWSGHPTYKARRAENQRQYRLRNLEKERASARERMRRRRSNTGSVIHTVDERPSVLNREAAWTSREGSSGRDVRPGRDGLRVGLLPR